MLTNGSLLSGDIDGKAPHLCLPSPAEGGGRHRGEDQVGWLGIATPYPPIDFEKAVTWCEQRTGKTLTPQPA